MSTRRMVLTGICAGVGGGIGFVTGGPAGAFGGVATGIGMGTQIDHLLGPTQADLDQKKAEGIAALQEKIKNAFINVVIFGIAYYGITQFVNLNQREMTNCNIDCHYQSQNPQCVAYSLSSVALNCLALGIGLELTKAIWHWMSY